MSLDRISNADDLSPHRYTPKSRLILETRSQIIVQLEAFHTYEEKKGVDTERRKTPTLLALLEKLEKLDGKGNTHAKNAEGVSDIPGLLTKVKEGEDDQLKKARGSKTLNAFFEKLNTPNNLFYLDRSLSEQTLEERIGILDELYKLYKNASIEERYYMEELINRMFGTQVIPKNVQDYLDHVGSLDSTVKSAGAENTNMIFVKHENVSMTHDNRGKAEVLKVSKGRHDIDFTSILKLMRNMHILMLKLNEDVKSPNKQTVKIRLVADNMAIYMDQDRHYKRIIKQPFAQGRPAQEVMQEMDNDPNFRDAWKTFLQTAEEKKPGLAKQGNKIKSN